MQTRDYIGHTMAYIISGFHLGGLHRECLPRVPEAEVVQNRQFMLIAYCRCFIPCLSNIIQDSADAEKAARRAASCQSFTLHKGYKVVAQCYKQATVVSRLLRPLETVDGLWFLRADPHQQHDENNNKSCDSCRI